MNKKLYIILAVVAVIVVIAVIWLASKKPANNLPIGGDENQTSTTMKADSVQAINQDLDSIDIGNLDEDFKEIDKDVNSL